MFYRNYITNVLLDHTQWGPIVRDHFKTPLWTIYWKLLLEEAAEMIIGRLPLSYIEKVCVCDS